MKKDLGQNRILYKHLIDFSFAIFVFLSSGKKKLFVYVWMKLAMPYNLNFVDVKWYRFKDNFLKFIIKINNSLESPILSNWSHYINSSKPNVNLLDLKYTRFEKNIRFLAILYKRTSVNDMNLMATAFNFIN